MGKIAKQQRFHGVELFSKTSRELVNILPRFRFERDECRGRALVLSSRSSVTLGRTLKLSTSCDVFWTQPFSPWKLLSFSIFPYEYICMKFSINFILFPLLLVQLWMQNKLEIRKAGRNEWIVFVLLPDT